jgi:Trypsin
MFVQSGELPIYIFQYALVATVAVLALTLWCATATMAHGSRYHWGVSVPLGKRSIRVTRREPLRARTAVVGGSQIGIASAPWQVEIFAEFKSGKENSCGGAILDSTHIVTAAHCAYDLERGEQLAPSALVVVGGIASMTAGEIKNNPEVQARFVSEIRVHPMFEFSKGPGTPDDVAVLKLETPLSFDASVKQIALSPNVPREGTSVTLTGFGEQEPGVEPNFSLYSLGMTTLYPRRCGEEADAVFTCASSPSGSGCAGDEGSGLTEGDPAGLVGVLDAVAVISGKACQPEADNQFVNLEAPEISEFLKGSSTPPAAPRGGLGVRISGSTKVGSVLTCEEGSWTNATESEYVFVDSTSGLTLQAGPSSTYELKSADIGRTIYCEVQVLGLGGTGLVRTSALPAVESGPPVSQTPPGGSTTTPAPTKGPGSEGAVVVASVASLQSTSIAVERNGAAAVKLACAGGMSCQGTLTLSVKQTIRRKQGKSVSRDLVIGRASYTVSAGTVTSVTVHLDSVGRTVLKSGHGRLAAQLLISPAGSKQTVARTVRLIQKLAHAGKGSS